MVAAYLASWTAACTATTTRAIAPRTLATIARAERYERAHRYDQARATYARAEREAPDTRSRAYAARQLADALLFWHDLRGAVATLARLTTLSPEDASAWHDLGIVRARLGDPTGAARALRRAITCAPTDPRPRIALAALLIAHHQRRAALHEYERLLDLPMPARLRRAVQRGAARVREDLRASPPRP